MARIIQSARYWGTDKKSLSLSFHRQLALFEAMCHYPKAPSKKEILEALKSFDEQANIHY
jgi:hypothetical protein